MWLFSKYGFFSVVLKPNGEFQLRARAKRHLMAMKSRFQLGKQFPVIETQHADYAFRLVLGQSQFANIASAMVSEIDYDNFKNECHDMGDTAYDTALMRIWGVMHQLQTNENPRQYERERRLWPSPHTPVERPPTAQETVEDIWANTEFPDAADFVDGESEDIIDEEADDEVPPTTYPPKPGSWSGRCETEGPFEV